MRQFNTNAVCIPSKHYMVDLSSVTDAIKKLVDAEKYFSINRARQYGKTTTLNALEKSLSEQYDVISIDFQTMTSADFSDENSFAKGLARILCDSRDLMNIPVPDRYYELLHYLTAQKEAATISDIFKVFNQWCRENPKPVVLIIDEVDTATNNQVFLGFLGKLRANYVMHAKNPNFKIFQSVILAGVTDIKHLKNKIRPDADIKVSSPWNIAADFDIDMSLSENGIKVMLDEYATEHGLMINTPAIARCIRGYTSGYPYFVSRICQVIDTKLIPGVFASLSEAWTQEGVDEAVKRILQEDNTFFDSVMGKLVNMPNLKNQLRCILLKGETISYLPDDTEQQILRMYGFISNIHNTIAVSNRIFEMRLYNYFIGESGKNNDLRQLAVANRNIFINDDGTLDVIKIMEHFISEHNVIHRDNTEQFLEQEGRERFLTYLSPIINGTGTYSIEEQTRDHKRMDVVIHYRGKRYIIEMKIWRGAKYNADGEKQIMEYLDYFGLSTGYMLSFNFNKDKKCGVREVRIGNKLLYEGVV